MATEQEHFNACREFQEYYDQTLRKVGTSAPAPSLGQTVNDYRRETLRQLKRTFLPEIHDLYKVNYRGLPDDAIDPFESKLLKVIPDAAVNPNYMKPGELKMIPQTDRQTGLRVNLFYGQESFVKLPNFGCETQWFGGHQPGRRVTQFITDRGRYNVAKARYE